MLNAPCPVLKPRNSMWFTDVTVTVPVVTVAPATGLNTTIPAEPALAGGSIACSPYVPAAISTAWPSCARWYARLKEAHGALCVQGFASEPDGAMSSASRETPLAVVDRMDDVPDDVPAQRSAAVT